MGKYTAQQLASRIKNIRDVENVMSKYAFLTYYKRYYEAMEKYWTDQNPTLTTNDQKLEGYAASTASWWTRARSRPVPTTR